MREARREKERENVHCLSNQQHPDVVGPTRKKFKNLRKTNKFTEEAQIVRCMDQIHADK